MTGDVDEQALAERVVATMVAKDAFSQWLGISVLTVAPRSVTVRMTVREEMLNGFGVGHGGVAFALADSALAFASHTHGRVTMSIDVRHPDDAALAAMDRELRAASAGIARDLRLECDVVSS